MKYRVNVRQYCRILKTPLVTSRFTLKKREGFIIRLKDEEGRIGFGEIAPLESFGSETFKEAFEFCYNLEGTIDQEFIKSIDSKKMCCRFAFQSAQNMINDAPISKDFEVAALIHLNDKIDNWAGYRTFKCKIGKLTFEEEKEALIRLKDRLPENTILRLDANGSLTEATMQQWLKFLDNYNIQYLEQPLGKGKEKWMSEIAKDYRTAIALDESVTDLNAFERFIDIWEGWFVVKPSLLGDLDRFSQLREKSENPIVYSSIFETGIGMENALTIAASDKRNNHALGFGTNAYFYQDGFKLHGEGPTIHYGNNKKEDFEKIWELCNSLNSVNIPYIAFAY